MSLFGRMTSSLKATPEKQIIGYSISELKSIFGSAITDAVEQHPSCPVFSVLIPAGIQGYYSSFLLDKAETVAVAIFKVGSVQFD